MRAAYSRSERCWHACLNVNINEHSQIKWWLRDWKCDHDYVFYLHRMTCLWRHSELPSNGSLTHLEPFWQKSTPSGHCFRFLEKASKAFTWFLTFMWHYLEYQLSELLSCKSKQKSFRQVAQFTVALVERDIDQYLPACCNCLNRSPGHADTCAF